MRSLDRIGAAPGHFLIDIGCGSGRLSTQLSRRYGAEIDYLGIDIVPELLDYARSKAIADYRFELTKGLAIPARDASADMIAAFSVFTHLKHAETLVYLRGTSSECYGLEEGWCFPFLNCGVTQRYLSIR